MQVKSTLAQLPAPDPSQFRDWLLSAAAALSLAWLAKQFIRKPPIEAEFLTRQEFTLFKDKLERDFDATWGKLDRSFETLSRKLEELESAEERRALILHDRIYELRGFVDRLDERTRKGPE